MSICSNKKSYSDQELIQYLNLDLFYDQMIEIEHHISTCDACQERLTKLLPLSNRSKGDEYFDHLFEVQQLKENRSKIRPRLFVFVVLLIGISGYFILDKLMPVTTHENRNSQFSFQVDSAESISANPFQNINNEKMEEFGADIDTTIRLSKSITTIKNDSIKEEANNLVAVNTKGADTDQSEKIHKYDSVRKPIELVQENIVFDDKKEALQNDTLDIELVDTLTRNVEKVEIEKEVQIMDTQLSKTNIIGEITMVPIYSDAPKPSIGFEKYNEYLKNNIEYPDDAFANDQEGEIIVEFELGNDRALKEIKIVKGITEECNRLILDVLKNGPVWEAYISEDYVEYNTAKVQFSFKIIRL